MGDIVETRQNELKNKKICRFCLTQNVSELTNIYSRENRAKTAPLPLQVMACVSIEVFSNDCMPAFVCNECRLIFDYCYRFKQMTKKADTCLRHYPLTGLWSASIEHPKIPMQLLQKPKTTPVQIKNLNALQIPKTIEAMPDDSPEQKHKPSPENATPSIPTPIRRKQTKLQVEIQEPASPNEDEQHEPKKVPGKSVDRKPPSTIKILNKSAIRILNKEAQKVIEPIMTKPTLQRDGDGNLSVVTQILEQDVPENKDTSNTPVLETNVFPCPHCERSFPLQQLLDIHMVNHNRERSFNCEFCEKSFFSKYDLQKHNLTHTGEKPFVCVVCNKGFTRSTLLHRHEKTHIDIPKFICVFCEKPFISQEEMEKHTERHRKNRPFVCKICNKAFAFKQGLERHEVVHCREQPFQCQYCDESFSTPSKLSRHLTAHAGSRPYPCKLCPKSYLLSHHLTRHARSHKNGSGSYKCTDCQKSFNTRDDLIYHSALHAAQTMICPLCKDAFDDIETVTEHVRQHAEGEAYACEFCDYIYMTSKRLDDHIKEVHADEMVAYNEDNKKNAQKAENNKGKQESSKEETIEKDIDEVIEEFLLEEFEDEKVEVQNVIVKDEGDWEKQLENATILNTSQGSENEIIGEEALELMNIIEMNESNEEPPVKVKKVDEKSKQNVKIISVKKEIPDVRRKQPTKTAVAVSPVTSNSSSPKENKKPPQKFTPPQKITPPTKMMSAPKQQVVAKSATPKTRQPTIQAALKAIPKSVSIKRIETATNSAATPKSAEKTPTIMNKKSSPRGTIVTSKVDPPQSIKITKQSPNSSTRMLRQRAETTLETKIESKTSPVAVGGNKKIISKSAESMAVKKNEESIEEDKKIVEMVIGDKKVKVKKITMSKAQVAEMTRDGRIQMKGGTMILKKSRTSSNDNI